MQYSEDWWTPNITMEEIELNGTLLDDEYDNGLYKHKEDKVLCKLYYLKDRDRFVVVRDSEHWSVISSQFEIDNLCHKYLNQEPKQPVKDAFVEYDTSNFNSFQSDLDLNDIENIKKHGRYLGKEPAPLLHLSSIDKDDLDKLPHNDLYYIESLDRFVYYTNDSKYGEFCNHPYYRKKYNIPYQDERMQDMY
jgi:hypothetical protein